MVIPNDDVKKMHEKKTTWGCDYCNFTLYGDITKQKTVDALFNHLKEEHTVYILEWTFKEIDVKIINIKSKKE
jgi:hypothetical protein